jgi:branched-chain amino acid transport system ATP-binding protein
MSGEGKRMLRVNRLSAGYSVAPVLHEISLELNRGEMRGVLGANNSGKSTLLKVIGGLVRPRDGEILLNGTGISELPPEERVNRGIVLVPERRRLFASMTVNENLLIGSYGFRGRRNRKRNLERSYDLFPVLKQRRRQIAGTLSGGEQQMLAITRGLMAEPEVLLLDEPSIGLSPLLIQDIYDTFEIMLRQGIAILLAEQNAYISMETCSYIYILSYGEIALHGESKALIGDDRVEAIYLGKT